MLDANATVYNKLNLSDTASELVFTTQKASPANCYSRVQVLLEDGTVETAMDWCATDSSVDGGEVHVDISDYQGQTVTIYIQMTDYSGAGSGYELAQIEII